MSSKSRNCAVSGKKSYSNRKQAMSAANSTGKLHGITLTAYKCPHCKNFHLTKNLRERDTSGGSLSKEV